MNNLFHANSRAEMEPFVITSDEWITTDEPLSKPYDMTIAYFALMASNICIIGPLGLWLTVEYCKKRHKQRYDARRPELVIFHNLFSLFFVVVYIPLHIIFFEILWNNNNTFAEWWEIISYDSMMIAVNLSLSLRVWHSFYDFQLAHYSSRQWKSILTDDKREEGQPVIVRFKHFLGMFLGPCFQMAIDEYTYFMYQYQVIHGIHTYGSWLFPR